MPASLESASRAFSSGRPPFVRKLRWRCYNAFNQRADPDRQGRRIIMTSEEMKKTMEFIVEQQAQTSVKLDRLSEKIDALAVTQDRSEKKWEKTEAGIRALLSIAQIHEQEISTLGQNIAEVSENGRATNERLNALINTVERQISEGRNGKS
jgi:hypothetical protein